MTLRCLFRPLRVQTLAVQHRDLLDIRGVIRWLVVRPEGFVEPLFDRGHIFARVIEAQTHLRIFGASFFLGGGRILWGRRNNEKN